MPRREKTSASSVAGLFLFCRFSTANLLMIVFDEFRGWIEERFKGGARCQRNQKTVCRPPLSHPKVAPHTHASSSQKRAGGGADCCREAEVSAGEAGNSVVEARDIRPSSSKRNQHSPFSYHQAQRRLRHEEEGQSCLNDSDDRSAMILSGGRRTRRKNRISTTRSSSDQQLSSLCLSPLRVPFCT